ncbi:MAG TPA: hypothetical protein VMZ06_11910 [Candidatus Bathyarchaeia archaeon]|nr:hypothetical protein [Candidatus Bathyarchaeia archaeon]
MNVSYLAAALGQAPAAFGQVPAALGHSLASASDEAAALGQLAQHAAGQDAAVLAASQEFFAHVAAASPAWIAGANAVKPSANKPANKKMYFFILSTPRLQLELRQ